MALFLKLPRIIGAIIVSLIFWLLVYMSKSHTVTTVIPVIIKLSDSFSPTSISHSKVSISIKGTGWELGNFFLSDAKWIVNIDPSSRLYSDNITFFKDNLNKYLDVSKNLEISVESVDPGFIKYSIGRTNSKKVPLRLSSSIMLEHGLVLSSPVSIMPDSIVVAGASSIIKNIEFLEVLTPAKSFSQGFFETNIPIKDTLSSMIDYQPREVIISGNVETLAELSIPNVPVHAINSISGQKATLIPAYVTVNLTGPTSKLASVRPDSIYVVVNYNDLTSDTSGAIVPHATCNNPLIKVKNIDPTSLKYVLQN